MPGVERILALDVLGDSSLIPLGHQLSVNGVPLRLVIVCIGLLHDDTRAPEERLEQVSRIGLEHAFGVNAYGPVLVAQALAGAVPRDQPCQFASVSARVGSITDNRGGGWYGYRASKAAQNQLLTCPALE